MTYTEIFDTVSWFPYYCIFYCTKILFYFFILRFITADILGEPKQDARNLFKVIKDEGDGCL